MEAQIVYLIGHSQEEVGLKDINREITTIRFEDKIDASIKLNLINRSLGEELKDIYRLRNAIHLHAEIKKGIEYEMEMSTIAYRRMKIFKEQIKILRCENQK